jgi:predicted O-methyltransferase YrrM
MVELEQYAATHNVPIMQKDGIEFLENYVKNNNIKKILEIGTAIGYSSIRLASLNEKIMITTIERNKEMYDEANKNIIKYKRENQIKIIFADALDVSIDDKFDLIFIDAAKAQYIKFFEKFKVNLKENGVIVSDNLNFHGLAENPDKIESKNLKALMKKLNKYKEFLKENKEFNTTFYEIGDGISISKRAI